MIKSFFSYSKLYSEFLDYNTIIKFISYPINKISSYPVSVNFFITSRCNFKCNMCSFYASEQVDEEELEFKEIKKIIEKISRYKPIIFLGGGEPFVRKDIYKIIGEINKNYLKCIISTNGYLLDVDKLSRLNLDCLIVSLYGPPEVHNKIVQIPDAYQTVINKIKQLLKKTSPNRIIVSVVLMPENILYLDYLIKEVISIGINTIKIENLNYITFEEYKKSSHLRGESAFTPCTLIRKNDFTSSDIELFWATISKLLKKYKGKLFLKPNLRKEEFFNWYSGGNTKRECHFIKHSIFVSSSGDILPCQFLKNSKLGKINQDDVKYLWHSNRYSDLRQIIRRADLSICKRCCK
ncbi:MAG: radical SAM protein [Candidatus Saelkia tenebricola]|nr:radical SAM protein [Candidatus Saelkia tenebricola]